MWGVFSAALPAPLSWGTFASSWERLMLFVLASQTSVSIFLDSLNFPWLCHSDWASQTSCGECFMLQSEFAEERWIQGLVFKVWRNPDAAVDYYYFIILIFFILFFLSSLCYFKQSWGRMRERKGTENRDSLWQMVSVLSGVKSSGHAEQWTLSFGSTCFALRFSWAWPSLAHLFLVKPQITTESLHCMILLLETSVDMLAGSADCLSC